MVDIWAELELDGLPLCDEFNVRRGGICDGELDRNGDCTHQGEHGLALEDGDHSPLERGHF